MKNFIYLITAIILGFQLSQGVFAEETYIYDTGSTPIISPNETLTISKEVKEQLNQTFEKVLPGAKIVDIQQAQGGKIKCIVSYKGTQIAFNIDPQTGNVSEWQSSEGSFVLNKPALATTKAGVQLTTVQVNKILKQAIPGAAVDKVKYDKQKGIVEGYAIYENLKYYFQIDALRGNVIKMEPVN